MSLGRFTEPLRLTPVLVPKPWGGRRLQELGYQLPPGERIGEAWLVADLDPRTVTSVEDPLTRVAEGPYAGRSLQQLIELDRASLLGAAEPIGGRFPLLVKLLDAREHLSVQLHPHAAYATEDPSVAVKTETWVVVDAEPGAELMLGLADGVTADDLIDTLGAPEVVDLLRRVPAQPGEIYHVPAGTVHALGAGVMVAEVQTPSDTTFRLYDWTDEYARPPRETHYGSAARCLRMGDGDLHASRRIDDRRLRTSAYTIESRDLTAGRSFGMVDDVVSVTIVLEGSVVLGGTRLERGESALVPAAFTGSLLCPEQATLLDIRPARSG